MTIALSTPAALKNDVRAAINSFQSKLAERGKQVKELTSELEESNETLARVFRALPRVVGRNASTLVTAGSAFAGGYVDEWLKELKSERLGPLNAVATIGAAVAVGAATLIENPDLAELGMSTGRGLLAGELARIGRDRRVKDREKVVTPAA